MTKMRNPPMVESLAFSETQPQNHPPRAADVKSRLACGILTETLHRRAAVTTFMGQIDGKD